MDEAIKVFFVMSALAASGAVGYLAIVLVHNFSKRIGGRTNPGDDELQYLRDQADEVDHLRERLPELENRMDFAERVLPRPEGRLVDD